MRRPLAPFLAACVLALPLPGQGAPLRDPLLEHLAGTWVLRGTLAGKTTTHDVTGTWELGHQYLTLRERARELDAQGRSQYEALVLLGWDAATQEYQCLWLDTTGGGGLAPQFLGLGRRTGEAIPFAFRDRDGRLSFTNTFAYHPATDTWTWALDNVQDGKAIPFGRVTLTRAVPRRTP
ncbi:hypothetical protein GETHPA_14380 [Geothrix rubra]|uniref:DUF1579 domain-containing protein n=1 Tax=Geothrix rubra TaxID=2927977 RepID=A0ABQ5Q739_9BACT|nr:hypothetical protein [Geothrix rubra]GLH69905.1 hypothetical protein GETHPA_14380 [Geothrix rubra]